MDLVTNFGDKLTIECSLLVTRISFMRKWRLRRLYLFIWQEAMELFAVRSITLWLALICHQTLAISMSLTECFKMWCDTDFVRRDKEWNWKSVKFHLSLRHILLRLIHFCTFSSFHNNVLVFCKMLWNTMSIHGISDILALKEEFRKSGEI